MSSVSSPPRGPYVGSRMRLIHRWVLDHIYDHVIAAGYTDLGRAHVGMIRYPGFGGLRPSELADRLQVTKQSVNDLLRDMEALGYLVRVPDPTDGRARIISLTPKGRALENVIYEGAGSAERAIANLLGPRRFAELRSALEDIVTHISNGDPAHPS